MEPVLRRDTEIRLLISIPETLNLPFHLRLNPIQMKKIISVNPNNQHLLEEAENKRIQQTDSNKKQNKAKKTKRKIQ